MRKLILLLMLITGCHTCPPAPTPTQRKFKDDLKRPKDRSGEIFNLKIPKWVKVSYGDWVRYGYDK